MIIGKLTKMGKLKGGFIRAPLLTPHGLFPKREGVPPEKLFHFSAREFFFYSGMGFSWENPPKGGTLTRLAPNLTRFGLGIFGLFFFSISQGGFKRLENWGIF